MNKIGTSVIHGNARFTAITDGLVRMEYSGDGRFEERTSIRIPQKANQIPFEAVDEAGNKILLKIGKMSLEYNDDGHGFNAKSLKIFNINTGDLIWQPGQIDDDNLGSAPVSMDNMSRSIIPNGVHSATTEHYDSDQYNLWNYCSTKANGGFSLNEIHVPKGEDIGLEQYLKAIDMQKVPKDFKELIAARSKYPPGLLSRSGYFLYNDSLTPLIDDSGDWFETGRTSDYTDYYFFYYQKDYRKALKDYITLFGHTPMIPKYAFGMWFTQYPFPSEEQLAGIVERFEAEDIPIDVMSLDLPWHTCDWLGFDWNKECINPDTYFPFCKKHKIHNIANIHPYALPTEDSHFEDFINEAGIEIKHSDILPPSSSGDSPVFKKYDMTKQNCADAFWKVFLKPLKKDGVDYFWYDGVASMGEKKKWAQFLSNYIFRRLEEKDNPQIRQMMMTRLSGFGGHRFPLHFTADAFSHWEVLKSQVEYTLRAGHIGYSFITHDIAGIQNYQYPFHYLDSELYCRWVQWGALSPVFRLHSSHDGIRLPWLYGDRVMKFYKKALSLRRELLPYFYTLMYESVKDGMPMLRSCALAEPDWENGYKIWDSYYLGEKLFVTPFLEAGGCRKVRLPEGEWYCPLTKEDFKSDGNSEFVLISVEPAATPHFIRKGTVIVKRDDDGSNAMSDLTYVVEIYSSAYHIKNNSDVVEVYEDDGESLNFENGEYRLMRVEMQESHDKISLRKQFIDGKDMSYLSKADGILRLYGSYNDSPVLLQDGIETKLEFNDDGYYTAGLKNFFGSGEQNAVIITAIKK